jgi:hypothetical protein
LTGDRFGSSECPRCGQSDVPEAWSPAWKVLAASLFLPPVVGLVWGIPAAVLIGTRQKTRAYGCPSCLNRWSEAVPGRGNPGI